MDGTRTARDAGGQLSPVVSAVDMDAAAPSASRLSMQALVDFVGGVAGGVASVYVGQPLDTIKVKMQTFPQLYSAGSGGGAWGCFMTTLRHEGVVQGLYAGTLPSLAAQVAENSILFAAYGVCQQAVASVCGVGVAGGGVAGGGVANCLSPVQNALAGSCAAFFSTFALCPTELVKCRMQAARELHMHAVRCSGDIHAATAATKHVGPWTLTRQIVQDGGVRALFRGFVPTIAREMPGYFFFFGAYEGSRRLLTPPGGTKDQLGPLHTVLCGGIGGVALWLAVFPADVIKSRMQVNHGCESGSSLSLIKTIVRNEGVSALYKGLGPTLLRTFPASGALFLAYETARKLLLPS